MAWLIAAAVVVLVALSLWWWRYRLHICPASAAWLVENPAMNAIAGPEKLFSRMGLVEGMHLLDIGCGPGRLTLPAAQWVGPSGSVTALDLQPQMIDKLHRHLSEAQLTNVHPLLGAAGSGLLQKNYYDRALLVTVLGEIRNREEALAEIFEALRPGGILAVTEIVFDPHYIGRKRLYALCEAAGFQPGELSANAISYSANFIKPAS